MLNLGQQSKFERLGLVRLPRAIPDGEVETMRDRVWRDLAQRYRVDPADRKTWTVRQPTGFQALLSAGAFAPLACPTVCEALDDLFGAGGWKRPHYWGQPLVTFPGAEPQWQVPHKQWHLDLPPRSAAPACPGVRVFAFLSSVLPRGGGTLVVTGSHRLVQALGDRTGNPLRSPEVRKRLMAGDPWFRSLCSADESTDRVRRFMNDGVVTSGMLVRVVELTGEPGDVILMHGLMLHAPAPNCRSAPRLMVAQWIGVADGG